MTHILQRRVALALATLGIAAGSLLSSAVPAAAASCPSNIWTSTPTNSVAVTNQGWECWTVQPRLTKYYASSITYYYGPEARYESHVSNANGTDAGKHYRYKMTSGSTFSGWVSA